MLSLVKMLNLRWLILLNRLWSVDILLLIENHIIVILSELCSCFLISKTEIQFTLDHLNLLSLFLLD